MPVMNVWCTEQYKSACLKDIPYWVLKDLVNEFGEPLVIILKYIDNTINRLLYEIIWNINIQRE